MKIAIVVQKLTGGGAERVAAMWAQGFAQNSNEVTLILSDNSSPITYNISSRVRLEYACSKAKFGILRKIDRIIQFRKILKSNKPNIIIGLMNLNSLYAYFASFGLKIPIIHTEHNSFERPSDAPMKLIDKIGKFFFNRILYDYITVLTQADKDIISNQIDHVTVLPNPLALTPAEVLPPKKKVVFATGRLDAWHYKGFDILIKAWAKIANKAEGWKLQIAGDSKKNGLKYLQSLCEEYGVTSSVDFVGYQSDILPFYQDASIFVLSSRYEAFGLVLIEAMSQGCACVACDYKGRQKEILLSEENGLTCEPENIEELANAVLSLIQDDDKRREIGSNAIMRSHDFSINKIMEKWNVILENI